MRKFHIFRLGPKEKKASINCYAVFLRKEHDTYVVHSTVPFESGMKVLNHFERAYAVNINKPAFVNEENKRMFLFDFESGSQLSTDGIPATLTPRELDTFMSQHILRELAAGVMDTKKDKILFAGLGLIIGILISAVGFTIYYNTKIQELYQSILIDSTIIPNISIISVLWKWFLCLIH